MRWIFFPRPSTTKPRKRILLSPDAGLIDAVAAEHGAPASEMARKEIIAASLAGRGALVRVRDLDEACAIANEIARSISSSRSPNRRTLVAKIRNAGAIFVGHFSSEALGDYCAGPNHVLPTARRRAFRRRWVCTISRSAPA